MEYRVPDISEFVDGFSFEVYSPGYWDDSIEDFAGWYRYTVGINNWRDLEEIEQELKAKNIRVEIINQKKNHEKNYHHHSD